MVEPSRTSNVRPTAVRSQARSFLSFRVLPEYFAVHARQPILAVDNYIAVVYVGSAAYSPINDDYY